MPRPERFIQILSLCKREDTGSLENAIAFEDHAAIVNRIVREENRFEHFRCRLAIHQHARFDRFIELNGLLDRDEPADPNFSQPFNRLNDDLDVFALLVRRHEDGQISQLRQHAAQLGLENDQHRQHKISRERCQQILQNAKLQNIGDQDERQQQDQKARHHRGAARAADEAESIVDSDRQ